jgi:hypothetical protein
MNLFKRIDSAIFEIQESNSQIFNNNHPTKEQLLLVYKSKIYCSVLYVRKINKQVGQQENMSKNTYCAFGL